MIVIFLYQLLFILLILGFWILRKFFFMHFIDEILLLIKIHSYYCKILKFILMSFFFIIIAITLSFWLREFYLILSHRKSSPNWLGHDKSNLTRGKCFHSSYCKLWFLHCTNYISSVFSILILNRDNILTFLFLLTFVKKISSFLLWSSLYLANLDFAWFDFMDLLSFLMHHSYIIYLTC